MPNRLIVAVALLCLASCFAFGQTLRLEDVPAQGAIVGQEFVLPLRATGGAEPYMWNLVSGDLPPGCKLQHHKGKIVGVPTATGEYRFTVAVQDSNIPHAQVQREFTIHVIEGLTIEWKQPPEIEGSAIRGSAIVQNQTPHEMVLTVVVVAVNEIGRATALGYQHFKLAADQTSPIIPFGSTPGIGTYYVRADAVAHHHHHIYRVSKQESGLKVTRF